MGALMWQPVGPVEPSRFSEAYRQAHNAAQWLVRLAHSYMAPAPDNSHTLLSWDSQRRALVTREFLPRLTVEMRIPDLALQFKEDGQPVRHMIEMNDRTPAEVEAWLLVELLHRGLDRDRFSKALPYAFPDLLTGDAIPYVTEGLVAELGEMAAWFANAAAILERAASENLAEATGTSVAVWCWPEIFHLRIALPLRPSSPPDGRQLLHVGFSIGGGGRKEPYFYVAPHDAGGPQTNVLTAAQVAHSDQPAEHVLGYLREAVAANRRRVAE